MRKRGWPERAYGWGFHWVCSAPLRCLVRALLLGEAVRSALLWLGCSGWLAAALSFSLSCDAFVSLDVLAEVDSSFVTNADGDVEEVVVVLLQDVFLLSCLD